MWNAPNRGTRPRPPSPRSLDDGVRIWRARDVYRARRAVRSLVETLLVLEGLALAGMGLWNTALLVVGLQGLALWGGAWLMRQAGHWGRTWWRSLGVVLLVSVSLSGCETLIRENAKLHGIKGDPFPGPCAPESLQAGRCLAVKQEQGKR